MTDKTLKIGDASLKFRRNDSTGKRFECLYARSKIYKCNFTVIMKEIKQ